MREITKSCKEKVWWVCPNGHSYCTTLHHRIKMNTGCGVCSHKVFLSGNNDLLSTNPEIAKEFDVEKNGITPDKVMAGSNNKKYWFVCPKGHSYSATLLNRKKGRNCPICSKEMHVSFPEKAICFYLKKYSFSVEENYRASYLKNKEFDIFIEDIKLAVEYDGKAWHKAIKRDVEKDDVSYKNAIRLIRIREIGCPDYDSTSIKYYVTAESISELEDAIRFVIKTANPYIESCDALDINIERDRSSIYESMELSEKSNSILIKRPEIEKFWDRELNGVLRPDQVSFSSTKIVNFICPEGHRWTGKIRNFYSSPKCPYCSGRRILKGFNDLGTINPILAKEWNYEKNNGLMPVDVAPNSNKKVWWKCDQGHEWQAMIGNRHKGNGCPICAKERRKRRN